MPCESDDRAGHATIARPNRKEGRYRMTIIPADFVTLEEEKMAETTKEWPHVFAETPFDHQIFLINLMRTIAMRCMGIKWKN